MGGVSASGVPRGVSLAWRVPRLSGLSPPGASRKLRGCSLLVPGMPDVHTDSCITGHTLLVCHIRFFS